MIDIDRYKKLKTETSETEEKIRKKVNLIHSIIGVDFKSKSKGELLENIDDIYEQEDEDLYETYVIIETSGRNYDSTILHNKTYVKKYLFDTPEIGLKRQQAYFAEELEKSNELLFELKRQKQKEIEQAKEQELKMLLDRVEELKKELCK